jgi:hypothetical protein
LTKAGEEWGFDGRGKYAHSGMLLAANGIRKEIEACGILSKLMRHDTVSASDATMMTPLTNVSFTC